MADLEEHFEGSHKVRLVRKHLLGLGLELNLQEGFAYIKPLDADAILSQSSGEVKSSETFNYRTGNPEENGLFSQKVFGPINDFSCACGKYKRIANKGKICDKCNVEVTASSVRNERSGHIVLTKPMFHPLFKEYLATQASMSMEKFDDIIYGGAVDIRDAFAAMLSEDAATKPFVLKTIPVIPPNMRPMVPLEHGRRVISEVNDLYRRVITRNNRLVTLVNLKTSDIILRNEIRMLQENLDHLIMNEKTAYPCVGEGNRVLQSLTSGLEGNLENFFEKTQDYSGTATASFNPKLLSAECALPIKALYTLYEPSVIHHMKATGEVYTVRSGRKIIEQTLAGDTKRQNLVNSALQAALKERPLVVSYQGIATALYSIVHEGDSFAVNGQVAQKLGLRFNGDKVNFYVPIQREAVQEAKEMIGNYISGQDREIDSIFYRLYKEGLNGITQRVVSGEGLVLSKLDQILLR